ncbi:MAG: HD domain-containing protein [Oligoflexia bacterium]|nr:HD domain-containing protein [Oligoflexia bacterium]
MKDELIPVDIQTFRNATRDIDFDVYLKLSDDNVAHVFSRTTGLDYKRLAHYIQKDVKNLYIKPQDLKAYQAFVNRPAHVIFADPNTTQEKKIATLLNMTEQNMAEIFTQFNVPEETAQYSQRLIRSYVDLMTQSPNTLAIILKLVSHGEYLYYHSIAVSIFSMFIAKASGQFNQRMLELVGMGGFLHDIGCTQIPKEILMSPTELTQEQWAEVKQHPKLGLNMIANTAAIPDEVRYIVYQHHEEPCGQGYPNAIHGPVIYYPAKIVALADAFSALISKRPFRPAYSVERALEILQQGTGRHDRELVKVTTAVFSRQSGKKAA